jgi:hypothetical protein
MEKPVLVIPERGIFRTTCEVEDTADAEVKVFRFKNWPADCSGIRGGLPDGDLRYITVYSRWSEFDVGEQEGCYRVTAKLETPEGFVAAFAGTTKPAPKPVIVPTSSDSPAPKIEDAIMCALERESRMTLRTLRRKTNAHRFGQSWDDCLKRLADAGELRIEQDPQSAQRTWIVLASGDISGVVSGINGNDDTYVPE